MLDKLVNFICFRVTLFNYPDPVQVRGSEVGQIMEVFQVVLMQYLEKNEIFEFSILSKKVLMQYLVKGNFGEDANVEKVVSRWLGRSIYFKVISTSSCYILGF